MKTVAVLSGGYSQEAQISYKSAQMVMNNIDKDLYHPVLVRIDDKGWFAAQDHNWIPIDKNDFSYGSGNEKVNFEFAFVMIHGTPGEDGILQGYFDLIGIPYSTGGVLNMSMTFDKWATKAFLANYDIPSAKSVVLKDSDLFSSTGILKKVQLPCFVKPNRAGSSFGASRVTEIYELPLAIEKAFREDHEVIVEEFLEGPEVTCGVIEMAGKPRSLPVTEIRTQREFFDFEAKYEGDSEEITPAPIDKDVYREVQKISEEIYGLMNCKGMIRVDYILCKNVPYLIEVNTVPGFSEVSIIPQQAAADGISPKELITLVIESCI